MRADRGGLYRAYVLAIMSLVYSFAVMDRFLFGIVQESVKAEFKLSDFQLGLIGGPAFAFVYAIASPFAARLAERVNRASMIGASVAVWSLMTMLCGMAGSFAHLILARVGIGVSESGCTPTSHSLLSDYFPPRNRALVLSIYSTGGGGGVLLAGLLGGWLTQQWGWRAAMLSIGACGLALSLLFYLTVAETSRTVRRRPVPVRRTLALLWRTRSYRHAVTLAAGGLLVTAGMGQFSVSFLIRAHQMSFSDAATISGVAGAFAIAGQLLAGWTIHRLSAWSRNSVLWVPGVAVLLASPVWFLGFTLASTPIAVVMIVAGFFLFGFQLGPVFAIPQLTIPRAIRPTATAIMLLVGTVVGQALGGPLLGHVSDLIATTLLVDQGQTAASCRRVPSAACALAQAEGLRFALAIWCFVPLAMAINFWLASKHFSAEAERQER